MSKQGLALSAVVFAGMILATSGGGQTRRTRQPKTPQAAVININRASAADFEKLPGIGPELARRIVAYRDKHGPFRRVEDLIAVRGISEKKWRAIRPYLTLKNNPTAAAAPE